MDPKTIGVARGTLGLRADGGDVTQYGDSGTRCEHRRAPLKQPPVLACGSQGRRRRLAEESRNEQ